MQITTWFEDDNGTEHEVKVNVEVGERYLVDIIDATCEGVYLDGEKALEALIGERQVEDVKVAAEGIARDEAQVEADRLEAEREDAWERAQEDRFDAMREDFYERD